MIEIEENDIAISLILIYIRNKTVHFCCERKTENHYSSSNQF